jgi:nitrate reductase alpha subunit
MLGVLLRSSMPISAYYFKAAMNTSTSVPVLFPDSFFQDAVLLQWWLQNDFAALCVLAREFSSVATNMGQQTPHLHLDLKIEI